MPWAVRRSVATIRAIGATALLTATLISSTPSGAIHIEILDSVTGFLSPEQTTTVAGACSSGASMVWIAFW